jgi:alpha-1,2-glucosyltransferase
MLYIWPYFLFFSWPILVLAVLNAIVPRSLIPKSIQQNKYSNKRSPLPRIAVASGFIIITLAIVHLNTIVHPFTLADNRHYVFYVFKLLLRHPLIKYLVTPIYFVSGWAVLGALGSPTTPSSSTIKGASSPSKSQATKTRRRSSEPESKTKQQPQQELTTSSNSSSEKHPRRNNPTRVSFLLVWFASTALSVITAPLVEPRYFIIPWVIWRLHIPATTTATAISSPEEQNPKASPKSHNQQQRSTQKPTPNDPFSPTFLLKHLSPLLLETIWLITINTITGYVFLYRGFEWSQEPGQVQRFLW